MTRSPIEEEEAGEDTTGIGAPEPPLPAGPAGRASSWRLAASSASSASRLASVAAAALLTALPAIDDHFVPPPARFWLKDLFTA